MPVAVLANDRALQSFLDEYATGAVLSCDCTRMLADCGNFLISTERGDYVLTVFASATVSGVALIPDLADFLARQQIPCPQPLRGGSGRRIGTLHEMPAVLAGVMRGIRQAVPEAVHCAAAGAMLARLHVAGRSFPQQLPEDRRGHMWRDLTQRVRSRLVYTDERLLASEMGFQALYRLVDLPRGIIHANPVSAGFLLEDGHASGLVGVPHFRTDALLYDLAVAVNDWCSRSDGGIDEHLARALLTAYHALRPLTALECGAWPVLLRAAALHSWLSALYDAHFPRLGWGASGLDPEASRRILLDRIETESMARRVWPDGRQLAVIG